MWHSKPPHMWFTTLFVLGDALSLSLSLFSCCRCIIEPENPTGVLRLSIRARKIDLYAKLMIMIIGTPAYIYNISRKSREYACTYIGSD